jgi:hypothetical protein
MQQALQPKEQPKQHVSVATVSGSPISFSSWPLGFDRRRTLTCPIFSVYGRWGPATAAATGGWAPPSPFLIKLPKLLQNTVATPSHLGQLAHRQFRLHWLKKSQGVVGLRYSSKALRAKAFARWDAEQYINV